MRILIIGNRSHQFITSYVRSLRDNWGGDDVIAIDVLSQEYQKRIFPTDSLYNHIYDLAMPAFLSKIRVVRGVVKQLIFHYLLMKLLKTQYDIIHIHYIEDIIKRDAVSFSKEIKSKLIISVWGSDFLRATSFQLKQMLPLFNKATKITIASPEVVDKFKSIYEGYEFTAKISVCRFGLQPIESLIKLYESKENNPSKKKIGLLDRITITLGYNASRGQQHIDIIHMIETHELLKKYRDKIEFLLPLTYPHDADYKEEIKKRVRDAYFQYKIIENFLSDNDVAILRDASDIFVQLQKTDMLSGSMLEHLAAGNIVITGSWLPYNCLKDWDVFHLSITHITDVSNELYYVMENYELLKCKTKHNFELIVEKFRWKNVINDWIKVYKE